MERNDELSDDVEFGLAVPATVLTEPGNTATVADDGRIMEAMGTRPPLPPARVALALVDTLELEGTDLNKR